MKKKRIFFRTDSSDEIGYGHLVRSIALASMLKDVFSCFLATRFGNKLIDSDNGDVFEKIIMLNAENDFDEFLELISEGDIVVLDNYFFNDNHEKLIKNKNANVICIDDLNNRFYNADIVINHSPSALKLNYETNSNSKLLLGLDYLLLRPAFFAFPNEKISRNVENPTLFICLGGASLPHLNINLIESVLQLNLNIEAINLVVGSGTFEDNNFKQFIEKNSRFKINIFKNIDDFQVVKLIMESDIGIVSGGGVLFECMSLSLPVICGKIIDNQNNNYNYVAENKLANVVGDFNTCSLTEKDFKFNKIDELESFIDLNSDKRLRAEIINRFYNIQEVSKLQLVDNNDLRILFDWANDSLSRKNSINQQVINFDDHTSWFKKQTSQDDFNFYILKIFDSIAVGMIRFDEMANNEYLLNYSIDKYYRGFGIGKIIVKKGLDFLKKRTKNKGVKIVAYVKQSNVPSIKIFKKLSFVDMGLENVKNVNLIRFELTL